MVKKGVRFDEANFSQQTPIHQVIPKVNAKLVRPQTPLPKPKISYEDILSKMGMVVSNGKLHLIDRNTQRQQYESQIIDDKPIPQNEIGVPQNEIGIPQNEIGIPQNSYIYNKLFKGEIQPQISVRRPKTIQEYKRMLVEDYIKLHRIRQMKSTKLIMPTSNINFAYGNSANLNKLFSLSKR